MTLLRGTLLSDGSSDRMLLPLIDWLFRDLGGPPAELRWANPLLFPSDTQGLLTRAQAAVELEPCDVLFVHRDAERVPLATRKAEITDALRQAFTPAPFVCVVPVRMTEAWFLFDEPAIRRAAGNPNGHDDLGLPTLLAVEGLPDPKQRLRQALSHATDFRGRRLERFRRQLSNITHHVSELIDDYTPLRQLSGFQAFEAELRAFVAGSTPCLHSSSNFFAQ
jgi:hypothetical protein